MKAVYFEKTGGIADLQVGELKLDRASLKSGEVRIKFVTGALNHLDLWVLKGLPHLKYAFPMIAGSDVCGKVVESKSGRFKVDDRVLLYPAESSGLNSKGKSSPENLCEDFLIRGESMPGVFSEEIVTSDRFVFLAPSHLSDEEAAALPLAYLTAWQMVTEKAGLPGQNRLDQKILVHGVGSGVSQAILEILLALGASAVATTSRSAKKLEPWQKRGVETFTIEDSSGFDAIKSWAGKEKISVIFDHVGESFFEQNIRLLRTAGRYITCGATSGFKANLDLRFLFFKQLQLLGSTMGSLSHFREVLEFVAAKKIKPKISEVFSFDQARSAYEKMEKAEQDGKLVLKLPSYS
jgi:NADPH:quinone reductase-like Zn-dependent oxidoreductase